MRRTLALPLVLSVLAPLLLTACRSAEERQADFVDRAAPRLRAALDAADAPGPKDSAAGRAWAALDDLYARRGDQPIWIEADGATEAAGNLISTLQDAGGHGLDPAIYHAHDLANALGALHDEGSRADPDAYARRAAELDPRLTFSLALFLDHLGRGRIAPSDVGMQWQTERRETDLAKALGTAVDGEGIAAAVDEVLPPHDQYRGLEKVLAHYREIAAAGGWPEVPSGAALSPGDDSPRVPVLRRRLEASGDLEPQGAGDGKADPDGDDGATHYDERLAAAVERFQARHGLVTDGVVGPEALEDLNVPAAERVRQIEANLERWRWLPDDLGERYILVNVPRFELQMIDGGDEVMRMKVVVGEQLKPTPMFSDRMTYVTFNPYWNIPSSIAREEILPKAAADPGYLAAHHMELVEGWSDDARVLDPRSVGPEVLAQAGDDGSPVRLRQVPGPDNPLGRIKFMFPNENNIYLHDTSADYLFDENVRTFSHGCIRVQEPVALASWVLDESAAEVRQRIASGETASIETPRQIPVHILYWTALVDDHGAVHFLDDLYGIDQRVLDGLAAEKAPQVELRAPETLPQAPSPGGADQGDAGRPRRATETS